MENKQNINPDCFFCHTNFSGSSVSVFNLRQLFRYLKIKLQLNQNSVLLCSQCNQLGCQLYQQIVELEVTQMKINHSLEQLVKKISDVSGVDSDVLQKLVKEKCISRLANVKHSQVKLKRLAQVRIVIPVPEDPVMSPISSSPSPPSPLVPEPEKMTVKMEVNNEMDHQPLNTSNPKPKSQKPSKNQSCRFCEKIQRKPEECCYHEAEEHPDKLLLEAKLDHITDSQFLQICEDVLERHNVVQSPLRNKPNRYGCLYCQNLYGKMKYLKHHTIQSHLRSLIHKVRQMQSQCQFPEQGNDHDRQIGLHHKQTSCGTLGGPGPPTSKILRKPEASSVQSRQNNLVSSEPPSTLKNNKIDNIKGNSQSRNTKLPGANPEKLPEVHIPASEPEDSVMSPESPSSFPASPSPLSPEPEETIEKIEAEHGRLSQNLKSKLILTRKRPPKIPTACRFCPKILTDNILCQYHEAALHPDKLLFKGKLDNTSDSQFLEICQDVLARHEVVKNQHGCLYCKNRYTLPKYLTRHTLVSHLPNIIAKLRQLQHNFTHESTTEISNDEEISCQYCNDVFKKEDDLQNHKTILCPNLGPIVVIKSENMCKVDPVFPVRVPKVKVPVPRKTFVCQFCPKTFQQSPMLHIHSTAVHYLHYLNKAKLEHISDEHFEMYCQDLFEGHGLFSRLTKNYQRDCAYCKKSFSNFRIYKSHLIDKHVDILCDKLKELQKEPPKIKLSSNESGRKAWTRVCPNCGKWMERHRMGTHLKFQCKHRNTNIFFKICKCGKNFYSLPELNKHCCPGYKSRPVQCDKCGTQLTFKTLKSHQLNYCGKARKKRTVQQRKKTFVQTNMSNILAKIRSQVPVVKINKQSENQNLSPTTGIMKTDDNVKCMRVRQKSDKSQNA